jgi:asparagine synthase (glutamine-hydrolysing)
MFAFAVIDHDKQILTLARDRMGEKPLYYGNLNANGSNLFVFGSELSAFRKLPKVDLKLNKQVLPLYLRHNYIPAPYSIYEGVQKLMPGYLITLELHSGKLNERSYWSLSDVIIKSKANPFTGSFHDAVDELEKLMGNVIQGQMISDVPLGAFLSGGIDSSAVVAMMQSKSSSNVKTFSIGFEIDQFDESQYARQVANHLGTDHTERIITEREALDIVPKLSKMFSEPFSDSSQIPTYLVAATSKQKVTVSLSGDAGDELFGGYNRYLYASNAFNKINQIPKPMRGILSSILRGISPTHWNSILSFTSYRNIGEKIHKVASAMRTNNPMDLYMKVVSHTDSPLDYLNLPITLPSPLESIWGQPFSDVVTDIEKMMAVDALTYLPDDILVKVDRTSMAVSLESRVPFLDHRLVEFAWSLPMNYKLEGGNGKRVLKEMLYKHVPKQIMDRPKMGFGIPLSQWLKGPLRIWAMDVLNEKKMSEQGVFKASQVIKLLNEHMTGKNDHGYLLWDFLMFQSWLDENN